MKSLPIGLQTFETICKNNYLYIDKTEKLLQLAKTDNSYFLSRPRRFGKSLTLSTLEAMFKGKAELFKGLYAEEWVKEQANHQNPVIKLDVSPFYKYKDIDEFNISIIKKLERFIFLNDFDIPSGTRAGDMLADIIIRLYKQFGQVVILIDEYDKPITDNIDNLEKANEIREFLRSFYTVIKDSSDYLRFVFITGVSKFSKVGVFSGFNNLEDISMDIEYGDIVGYTQQELEENFVDWIEKNRQAMSLSREELLKQIKRYYDGFSFDGKTRVYNPFSVLNLFKKCDFRNYWYISALPSFLVKYFKKHGITNPDKFRHIEVESDFADEHEIESSTCESFLYQAGYLTIEKKEGNILTLDYPNWEVLSSISRLYLKDIYQIEEYRPLGNALWNSIKTLQDGNVEEIVNIFNSVLEKIPYIDFPQNQNESWYRSLFVVLLRGGAGVTSFQESYTKDGRADLIIPFDDKIIIIEFKFANSSKEVDKKRAEAQEQLKRYAESYKNEGKKIISVVLIADNEKKQIVL